MKKNGIYISEIMGDGYLVSAICRTLKTDGEIFTLRGREYFADFKNREIYRIEDVYRLNYNQRCKLVLAMELLESYYAKRANHYLKYMGETFRVKEGEAKRIDNDLYIFDPHNSISVSLGRMGNGWVCLEESAFADVWEK